MLRRLLTHPATRGLDLDQPETTAVRQRIIRSKPFLEAVYEEWYQLINDRLPSGKGLVVELGSGGGFAQERIPDLVTSDVFEVPGVRRLIDANELPFGSGELRGIVMTNVFHHLPDVARFLSEAQRCLRRGGRIVMIEPWNTRWSRFLHKYFHHEPMDLSADWTLPESGPLSRANAALPWIVLERDRRRFRDDWRNLRVAEVTPFMPFRYVLAGGISMRSLQPMWTFKIWRRIEAIGGLGQRMALLALVVLERV